jgi:hypothetical protein
MLESGSSGSVRGVLSNEHPYRESRSITVLTAPKCDFRYAPESRHRLPDRPCPKGANTGSEAMLYPTMLPSAGGPSLNIAE